MGRWTSSWKCPIAITIALALGLATSPAFAQQDVGALKAELDRLKAEVESIKSELRSIREFLQRRSPSAQPTVSPPRVVAQVNVAGNPTLGKQDAAVTLVEFSDYQCPFCRQFFENTLPALKKEYVDTGKARYVFRDFPLDSIHPNARKAAEAAHCAGEQGMYWKMHDTLFQNQQALQVDQLTAYAELLKLDVNAFQRCVENGTYASKVQKDFDEGVMAGIQGTPGFFVGRTRGDGSIQGLLIRGARPLNEFRQEIERALAEK